MTQPFIEQDCTIEHEGHKYTAGGAIVTEDRITAYIGKDGVVTDWHGNPIGTYVIASSWPIHSYISREMYAIHATVNGKLYKRTRLWRGNVLQREALQVTALSILDSKLDALRS